MIAGVFAVDDKGGIGHMGRLPWPSNKDDMQWFKQLTQHQIVVMGRKTWESPDMPKPLPGRLNVLFTNNFIDRDDIEQIRGDVCEALTSVAKHTPDKTVFVIGGSQLLTQSRPVLDKIFITRIPGEFLSDTHIDLDYFLDGFILKETRNLGSCKVEEYYNETIS